MRKLFLILFIISIALFSFSFVRADWWDDSYSYRYPIISDSTGEYTISVNDNFGVSNNIIWANIDKDSYVYCENSGCDVGAIAIANETNQKYWEDETSRTGNPTLLWSGSIGVYHFGEGSGTQVYDSSLNGNNGQLNGGSTFTTGIFGGGVSCDGISGYITIPNSSSINFGNNDNITIEIWMNPATVESQGVIMGKYFYTGGYQPGWMIFVTGAGSKKIQWAEGSGWEVLNTNTVLNAGQWYHLVFVRDETARYIYINGNLDVTGSKGSDISNTNNLNICFMPPWELFNGIIDEVRIWNYSLTADEILQHYYNGINNLTILGEEETHNVPFHMTFVDPTPLKNYISRNFAFINISSNVDLLNASLRWNGIEEPMSGSGRNWFLNKTNLLDGKYIFKVFGTDMYNNISSTYTSWMVIDTTPPFLSNPTQANNSYITGTFAQTFSIQVSEINVKKGTLFYLRNGVDSNWQSVALGFCSGNNPTCSVTIDASGVNEGNTISYYFQVYDKADNVGYYGNASNNLITTIDRTSPSWSNSITYPVSGVTYAPGQSYQFNITVTDNVAVDKVLFEINFTGIMQEYTATEDGNVYYVTLTDLPATSPNNTVFQWYMNDTAGNENYADLSSYSINKAPSQVSLLINGSDNNITVTTGENVNITGELIIGQGAIFEYENDLLIAGGSSPLMNITSFDTPGTYNITLVYYETENYTGVSTGISVVINETGSSTSPSISSVSLPSTHMTTFNTLKTNNANPVETRFIIVQSDSDNDGVPDSQDKCPNTIGKQIVYGCSCEQILKFKPGNNNGELKKGCSQGTIDVFTKQIGWAKHLFG